MTLFIHTNEPKRHFWFDFGDLNGAHGMIVWEDDRTEQVVLSRSQFEEYSRPETFNMYGTVIQTQEK